METEDTFHCHIFICSYLCKRLYYSFIRRRRLENFVFVWSVRTDPQYYSSSFSCSPALPLENSFLFWHPGPVRPVEKITINLPVRPFGKIASHFPARPFGKIISHLPARLGPRNRFQPVQTLFKSISTTTSLKYFNQTIY